ncbi:probable polygalacturonase At3g15720 [Euphorbia lathyris]|uniref:probable polygalacturonase At3g15720 n=1 Tax=Euphorbia lathyris TaxID=212925 RepID=UPI00331402C9
MAGMKVGGGGRMVRDGVAAAATIEKKEREGRETEKEKLMVVYVLVCSEKLRQLWASWFSKIPILSLAKRQMMPHPPKNVLQDSKITQVVEGPNVVDFGAVGDGETDDSNAFQQAWKALCQVKEGTPSLEIPQGKTFLLQPVKFSGPCASTTIIVQVLGKIVAPASRDDWKECPLDGWLSFSDVANLSIVGSGTIDGQGCVWWTNQKLHNFVKAMHFSKCDNLQLSGLTHINSPKNHISISDCNGVSISNPQIQAPKESPNTDGIDISQSTYVNITDSNIGTGDDCVAINGQSYHITITNVNCGPGHGISVGRLGKDGRNDTVEDVQVQYCTFNGTQNGARIKTWQGGLGFAKTISFEHITLIDTQNPILIDQYYCNGGHNCQNGTTAVVVSDVTYRDFHGSTIDNEAIKLECSETIGCNNIIMEDINITSSSSNSQTQAYCQNVHGSSHSVQPIVPCLTSLIS